MRIMIMRVMMMWFGCFCSWLLPEREPEWEVSGWTSSASPASGGDFSGTARVYVRKIKPVMNLWSQCREHVMQFDSKHVLIRDWSNSTEGHMMELFISGRVWKYSEYKALKLINEQQTHCALREFVLGRKNYILHHFVVTQQVKTGIRSSLDGIEAN